MATLVVSLCRNSATPVSLFCNSVFACCRTCQRHEFSSLCVPTSRPKLKNTPSAAVLETSARKVLTPFSSIQYSRLLPCPSQWVHFPRIEHLVVPEDGPVLNYICKSLDLPPLYVTDLIQFGAVYCALVCPPLPPTATQEQIKLYNEVTAPSALKRRRSSSLGKMQLKKAQRTFRVTHPDEYIEAGSYLRVHVHPKRFPRCYEIDWRSRILDVREDYVVLDKPAGVPVGGTTDNIVECCATFVSNALGSGVNLKTTHQIDNCTEGCLVLARTNEHASAFHVKIREKKLSKLYVALAAAPVPVGIITHYMRPYRFAPRLVSDVFSQEWDKCELQVLECTKVLWPDAVRRNKYGVEGGRWPVKGYAYECKINLLTGRTHQIRAQLAACGAPIVGDTMYMPPAIAEMENPKINPFRKSLKPIANLTDDDIQEWVSGHGKEPSVAIGLQACEISWDDGMHVYRAGAPWWRR